MGTICVSVNIAGNRSKHGVYILVYESTGSPVVGLGLVAIREAIVFLKHGEFEWDCIPLAHAIGFGASQTGRVLRHFLYAGLNDVDENLVLDAVMPHIAGGQRGDFNHRFAQPSNMEYPHWVNFSRLLAVP